MANRFPIDGFLQTDLNANSKSLTLLKTAQFTSSGVSVIGETKHVFLSVRTDGIAGSGLQLDPYDASTQVKLDAILTDNAKCPVNTCIHFLPGTFLTKCVIPKNGWRIYATPETTIKLDVLSAIDVSGLNSGKIAIFGKGQAGAQSLLMEDLVIEGGVYDLNLQNQTQPLCPMVVFGHIDGLICRNFKVINFGTTTTGEAFVVGAGANGNSVWDARIHKKGVVLDGLVFTQSANVTNLGAVSLCAPCTGFGPVSSSSVSIGWFEGGTVRNCYFYDIDKQVQCINLASYAKGLHCHHNQFINLTDAASGFAYYWDTGSGQDIKLENDIFINVQKPINLIGGANYYRTNIEINHEMINTSNGAIGITDQNLLTSGLTIADCIIIDPAHVGGIGVTDIQGVRLRNNVIDTNGFEIYHNGDVTHASVIWERFNNRKLDGTAVSGESLPGDTSTNTSTSVVSEVALFSDTAGKTLKRATGSGIAKLTSGVLGTAASGTDYAPATSGAAILYGNASGGFSNVTVGSGLAFSGGTLTAGGGTSATIQTTSAVLKGDGAGNAVAATQTGSGNAVLQTSPTLTTPTIGVATATSVNKWVLTAPSTAATLVAGADSLTYTFPAISCNIGFREIPQNSQSTSYTTVLTDNGKEIFHPVADNNARTFTIAANASVAYNIGTVLVFTNMAVANLSVAINSDTLTLLGAGTTGTRTVAQYGQLIARKITSTSWVCFGINVS